MRRMLVATTLAVASVVPAAVALTASPAAANTCTSNLPGGDEACRVILGVEGAVCRHINKPCFE